MPNYCALPNEMPNFPLNCRYYSRANVPSEVIDPKYPCVRCSIGFTGVIAVLTTPLSFPSHQIINCQTAIPFCDAANFPMIKGADLHFNRNPIKTLNFLAEKYFSCVKCEGNRIPVATLSKDPTLNAFVYKAHDKTTFSTATITTAGDSMACRDTTKGEEFGLLAGDANFNLDPNCGLAVIDLSQTIISDTKSDSR